MEPNENPVFEFTYKGELFKIYEAGSVKIVPSLLDPDTMVIMNRIPQLIKSIFVSQDLAAELSRGDVF